MIDDQPPLRPDQLACTLGVDELIIIDVAIAENVADGDVAQFETGGVGDAPYPAIGRDFQAAAVIGQIIGYLLGTIGLLLREQAGKVCLIDRSIGWRQAETAGQYA